MTQKQLQEDSDIHAAVEVDADRALTSAAALRALQEHYSVLLF